MLNPFHIIEGWFSSLIWSSKRRKALSDKRLKHCDVCPDSIESSFLMIRADEDKVESIKTKKCSHCGCPNVEKSLVLKEKCDIGKWGKVSFFEFYKIKVK